MKWREMIFRARSLTSLFLVTILTEPFFTLMSSHFMAFSFLTAGQFSLLDVNWLVIIYKFAFFTASRSLGEGLNVGTILPGTLTGVPVRGFTALRGARLTTLKVPKRRSSTVPPRASSCSINFILPSKTAETSALVRPVASEIVSTMSARFILSPF
jgi:hypothetical protein